MYGRKATKATTLGASLLCARARTFFAHTRRIGKSSELATIRQERDPSEGNQSQFNRMMSTRHRWREAGRPAFSRPNAAHRLKGTNSLRAAPIDRARTLTIIINSYRCQAEISSASLGFASFPRVSPLLSRPLASSPHRLGALLLSAPV